MGDCPRVDCGGAVISDGADDDVCINCGRRPRQPRPAPVELTARGSLRGGRASHHNYDVDDDDWED